RSLAAPQPPRAGGEAPAGPAAMDPLREAVRAELQGLLTTPARVSGRRCGRKCWPRCGSSTAARQRAPPPGTAARLPTAAPSRRRTRPPSCCRRDCRTRPTTPRLGKRGRWSRRQAGRTPRHRLALPGNVPARRARGAQRAWRAWRQRGWGTSSRTDAQLSNVNLGCSEVLLPTEPDQHKVASPTRCLSGVRSVAADSTADEFWQGVVPQSASDLAKAKEKRPKSTYHLAAKKLKSGQFVESEASDDEVDTPKTCASKHFSRFAESNVQSQFGAGSGAAEFGTESEACAEVPVLVSGQRSGRHFFGRISADVCNATEPERNDLLGYVVHSRWFEFWVRVIVFSDCAYMAISADSLVANDGIHGEAFWMGDLVFLCFYLVEVVLKLLHHRLFFFLNDQRKMNILDLSLVVIGSIDLLNSSETSSSVVRTFRVLKIVRGLRVLKVLTGMDRLRGFVQCLEGSFEMLFWCIVMLTIVFYMFSLIFLHLVAIHLAESGFPPDSDEKSEILRHFGSAIGCMLTLWQAVSGGDDWSNPYNAISLTGDAGALIFVAFIVFTSIALLNIIQSVRRVSDAEFIAES
ncbi:unnamed protein product, partial [Prorocentrum cordatum]